MKFQVYYYCVIKTKFFSSTHNNNNRLFIYKCLPLFSSSGVYVICYSERNKIDLKINS